MSETPEVLTREEFLKRYPEGRKIVELVYNRTTSYGSFIKGLKVNGKEIVSSIHIDIKNQLVDVNWSF